MAAITPTEVNARSAAVSAVLLSVANLFSKLTFTVIGIWLTRFLGPADAGIFFTAYAFLGLFAAVPDCGVSPLMVREAARRPSETPVIYGSGLGFFAFSGTLTYLVMIGSAAVLGYDPLTLTVIAILSIVTVAKAGETVAATILQLRQELHLAAVVQFLAACASFYLIYRAVQAHAGLADVSWILAGAGAGSALAMLAVGVVKCRPRIRLSVLGDLVKDTYWFALSGFLANFYLWGGAIILSRMVPEADMGQYSAAFRLISMLYIIPFILFNQVFTPMMFAWAKSDPDRLRRMYLNFSRHMVMLGTAFAVGLFVLDKPIIHMIYGDEFLPGAAALQILAWALPLRFFGSSSGSILTVTDHLGLKVVFQVALVAMTVVLSLAVVPVWGYLGAAVTVVSIEATLAAFFWYGARKHDYRLNPFRDLRLERIAAAAVAMAVLVRVLQPVLPLPAVVACGGVCYLGMLFAFRYFDANDRRLVRDVVGRRK